MRLITIITKLENDVNLLSKRIIKSLLFLNNYYIEKGKKHLLIETCR